MSCLVLSGFGFSSAFFFSSFFFSSGFGSGFFSSGTFSRGLSGTTAACCSGEGGGGVAGVGGAGFGGSGLVSFLVSGAGGFGLGLSIGLPALSTFGAAVMSESVASSIVGGASSTSGLRKDGTPNTISSANSMWNSTDIMTPPVIG